MREIKEGFMKILKRSEVRIKKIRPMPKKSKKTTENSSGRDGWKVMKTEKYKMPKYLFTTAVPIFYMDSEETCRGPQPPWSQGMWDMVNVDITKWYSKTMTEFSSFRDTTFEVFAGSIPNCPEMEKMVGPCDFVVAILPIEGGEVSSEGLIDSYQEYFTELWNMKGVIGGGKGYIADLGLFPVVRLGPNPRVLELSKEFLNQAASEWYNTHPDKNNPYLACNVDVLDVVGKKAIKIKVDLDAPDEEIKKFNEEYLKMAGRKDRGVFENPVYSGKTAVKLLYCLLGGLLADYSDEGSIKKPMYVFWKPVDGSKHRQWEFYFTPVNNVVHDFVIIFLGILGMTGINIKNAIIEGHPIPRERRPEPLVKYDGGMLTLYNFEHHRVDEIMENTGFIKYMMPEYNSMNAHHSDKPLKTDRTRYMNQEWIGIKIT